MQRALRNASLIVAQCFRAVALFVPAVFTAARSRRPVVECNSIAAITRRKRHNVRIKEPLLVRCLCSARALFSASGVAARR